jgi:hypothetical protein
VISHKEAVGVIPDSLCEITPTAFLKVVRKNIIRINEAKDILERQNI